MNPGPPIRSAAALWPEVVIFDCDGVLVDSEMLALSATRRAVAEVGLRLTLAETRARYMGLRLDAIIRKIESEIGAPTPRDFADGLSRDILEAFSRDLKGVEGVREAIAGLAARVCVASSSPAERVSLALRAAEFEALFAPHIFSAADVARGKPYPDLFLHAARAMGARAADCLVIEDSVPGVVAARAAGMAVFGFAGGSHFEEKAQREALTAAGAELIFDDMRRLPKIIGARGRPVAAFSGVVELR